MPYRKSNFSTGLFLQVILCIALSSSVILERSTPVSTQPVTLLSGLNQPCGITYNQNGVGSRSDSPSPEVEKLLSEASHILTGEVTGVESQWEREETRIFSDVTISVKEVRKGAGVGDQVVVRCLGGQVGDLGQKVSNEPEFSVGELVRVYLNRLEDGNFRVVAGDEGKTLLSGRSQSTSSTVYFAHRGIHWASSSMPVTYYINEAGTADCTDEFQGVNNSFQTWEDDMGSTTDYTYGGTTTRQGGTYDGYNVVSWGSLSAGVTAQCTYWYYVSTLLLVETDIVFNDDYTWSTTGESGKYDVQNIGTHEAGHTLVLHDLYASECSDQTMYGYGSTGETKKRTLADGDIAGVRFVYPVSYATATLSPEADAYVDSEYPTSNYGGSSYLYVRNSYDSTYRLSYLRFDISSFSSSSTIQSAVLQVYNSYVFSGSTLTGVHYCSDNTWSETGITWNNKPSYESSYAGTQNVTTEDCWYAWDVTSTVQSHLSDGKLTVVLKAEGTGDLFSTGYYSDEYSVSEYRPRLLVTSSGFELNLRTLDWSRRPLSSCNVTVSGLSSKTTDSGGWANFTLTSTNTYTVTATWQGSTVNQTSITVGTSGTTTDIHCRVYSVSIDFKYSDGSGSLYRNPNSITIVSPNGTTTTLASFRGLYLQNGSFTVKRIMWQGKNVKPAQDPTFDPSTSTSPSINCRVYSINVPNSFRDASGRTLYAGPSSFKLECPNGTTVSIGAVSTVYLQNGTFRFQEIQYMGVNVIPGTQQKFDPTDGTPIVNCLIYDLKIIIKDPLGLIVSGAEIKTYHSVANLSASGQTDASGIWTGMQLPVGDYTVETRFLGSKTSTPINLSENVVREVRTFPSYATLAILITVAVALPSIAIIARKKRKPRPMGPSVSPPAPPAAPPKVIVSIPAPTPPPQFPRFCIECGTPLKPGQNFCGGCGRKLEY